MENRMLSGDAEDRPPHRPKHVQSVDRALRLLELIGNAGPDGVGLADLARSLSMSRSATWSVLQTLLTRGFVAETGTGYGRAYVLGMTLARLGDQALSQVTIREIAMPHLRGLTDATGLTSRLALLHDSGAVVVA